MRMTGQALARDYWYWSEFKLDKIYSVFQKSLVSHFKANLTSTHA